MRVCMLSCFSRVQFFVTLQTIVRQASLSMRILQARILQWVAMPYPGNIPDPEIKSAAPAPRADSLLLSHRGSPRPPSTRNIFLYTSLPTLYQAE